MKDRLNTKRIYSLFLGVVIFLLMAWIYIGGGHYFNSETRLPSRLPRLIGTEKEVNQVKSTQVGGSHSSYRVENSVRSTSPLLDEFRGMDYNFSKFTTLDQDGKLTIRSLAEAGLSGSDSKQAQEIIDSHREQMRQIMIGKTKEDSVRSDPANGVYAYTISSFSDDGIKALKTMIEKLNEKFGDATTRALLSGYPAAGKYFQYGINDVYIKVYKGKPIGSIAAEAFGVAKENWTVETVTRDIKTGQEVSKGLSSLRDFNSSFGKIFEIGPPSP